MGFAAARLFRVLRILRLFRALRFLNEVDIVLVTVAKATFKLSLLVLLVVFISAIVTTNLLWDAPDERVTSQFSDLGTSMWTMFKLMTLDNWIDSAGPVIAIKPCMKIFFVAFIFCGSIALMSLVPAIFIELNLDARKRQATVLAMRRKKELFATKKALLQRLFQIVDDDANGYVSVSEMSRALASDITVRQLQEAGLTKEGELRDLKLGLFDLYEEQLEEHGENADPELGEAAFLKSVLDAWGDVDERCLWRSVTSTRKQLRELSNLVRTELSEIRQLLSHVSGATPQALGSPGKPQEAPGNTWSFPEAPRGPMRFQGLWPSPLPSHPR
mmetsp:Transcript_8398/g.19377  ORF Transcript_8398/g.19377 Transcript_8398/m.19377 type:complete len:330 (+) Transcript_8398:3-992(+)